MEANVMSLTRRSMDTSTSRRLSLDLLTGIRRKSLEIQMYNIYESDSSGTNSPNQSESIQDFIADSKDNRYQIRQLPFGEELLLVRQARELLPAYIAHIPTDQSLLMALRGCSYKLKRAAANVMTFELWQRRQLVNNISLNEVYHSLKKYKIFAPGVRDHKGRTLLYILSDMEDIDAHQLRIMQRTIFFVVCQLIKDPTTQLCGISVIQNMHRACANLTQRQQAQLVQKMWEFKSQLPVKIGGYFMYNAPSFWCLLLAAVWPMLQFSTSENIVSIGRGNSAQLRASIPKESLIEQYGGTLQFDLDDWAEKFCTQCSKPGISVL